jgi:DNA-binding beta-propeller fold protein YncE
MPLDKDRNRILDDQQDCDADGIPDLTALEGAWDGWAASLASDNAIREYHSITGVLMRTSQAGRVNQAQDLVITPDRRILVSSGGDHKVVEFDRTGAYVRDLVAAGSGGLSQPAGMVIAPWGNLLVCSRGTNSVLEYNIGTGAFVRAFVAPGAGGLASPFALTFKPGGDLFVTSGNTQVLEFNRTTGAFVRIFVTAAGNGGLNTPRGMVFKPTDGNLLVTSFATDQVKQYDGATGAFISNWQVAGIMLDQPWGLRIGPDGLVYMSQQLLTDTHVTRARILIFDIRNGNFIRAYVQANDSNLTSPTGFDFMPGNLTDCNHNQLPDSCDIASGRSSDINHNGIPDECEGLCYANCDLSTTPPILNVNDFICFQTKYAAGDAYANCDGSTVPPVLNVNDFICFQTRYARGCP